MNERNYNRLFALQDEYRTDPTKLKKRHFPSLHFYSRLIRILFYANKQARKGIYDDINWTNSSINLVESLENTGIKLHFSGMLNLNKVGGPVIFVSNHMSTLETMVLPSIIHPIKKIIYIIKEELSTYPVFGTIALARDPIIVGRENAREDLLKVLNVGTNKITEGKSIIVFPQRTRTLYFNPNTFNTLGIKLAKKNNVPIIPIALVTDAWGNGKLIKEVGKIDPSKEVKICFGEPLLIKGTGTEEHQKIIGFICNKFKKWGRSDLIKQ